MIRAVSLVICGLLLQAASALASDWPNKQQQFAPVPAALASGDPVKALSVAHECKQSNPFCGWYVISQLWHLEGDPAVNSQLEELRQQHRDAMREAVEKRLPEAVTLDVLVRANRLSSFDASKKTVIDELKPALEEDYPWAYMVAGDLSTYMQFEVRSRDGLEYYVRASELGFRQAMIQVAEVLVCRKCPGEPQDNRGWGWLNQAIVLQYAPAMTRMGEWYSNGYVVNTDPQQAKSLLRQGLEYGDANARCHLGEMALYGRGMDIDPASAQEQFEAGMEAGGKDCALLLGIAYDDKRISPDGIYQDDNAFRRCAEQGDPDCTTRLGVEWLAQQGDGPVADNEGVALLTPLIQRWHFAAYKLGRFYHRHDSDEYNREAYEAYQYALANDSSKAYFDLVSLLIDNADAFTESERSQLPEIIEKANETGEDGLTFTLAMIRARGLYLNYDPEEARKWGWAAINSAIDSDKQRLLKTFEKESSFVDDEPLKWAIRFMTDEPSDDSARVSLYVNRLLRGHQKQKEVAARELLAYVDDEQLDHRARAGMALSYSDPDLSTYDKEQFRATAGQLLTDNASLDQEIYYWLGKRAHIGKYEIRDNDLAYSLFQESGEIGMGLLARLATRNSPEKATQILEQLAQMDTRFNGRFYNELGRYARLDKYDINRPDLARVFYLRGIKKGNNNALKGLLNTKTALDQPNDGDARQYLYDALAPDKRAQSSAIDQLVYTHQLVGQGSYDKKQLQRSADVLRELSTLDTSEHELVVNYATLFLASLLAKDSELIAFDGLEKRKFLSHCVETEECPGYVTSGLALNLIGYDPLRQAQAGQLMSKHQPEGSADLSNSLRYYARVNDVDKWTDLIASLPESDNNEPSYIRYMALEPLNEYPRDFVYKTLSLIPGSVDRQLDDLLFLLEHENLRPETDSERQLIKRLLTDFPEQRDKPDWLVEYL